MTLREAIQKVEAARSIFRRRKERAMKLTETLQELRRGGDLTRQLEKDLGAVIRKAREEAEAAKRQYEALLNVEVDEEALRRAWKTGGKGGRE